MPKTKVCFIATYAWALFADELRAASIVPSAQTPFGGSEIQLYQFALELAKDSNYDVSFIVGDFGQDKLIPHQNIRIYKALKADDWDKLTIKSKAKHFSAAGQSIRLWHTLRKVNADIYIQRAAGGQTGIIARFCQQYRRKFIYMAASRWDVSGDYVRRNGLRGRIFEWGLTRADRIVVQNHDQLDLLSRNYHRSALVIKNAYHISDTPPILVRGGSPLYKLYILWVGRAEPLKQPELFFQLARRFPNEQFVMVAQSAVYHSQMLAQLKTQAQEIPNLKFIDYVPFSEIDNWFRQAKVFVNTSDDYEGFPNTFIQSALHATPVVSLKVNPDNFINQHQCGLCADGDPGKLTSSLQELLADPALQAKLGNNALNYARANHDIRKIMPAFKQLLQTKNVAIIIPNLARGGAERMASNLSLCLPAEREWSPDYVGADFNITLILFDEKIDYPYKGKLIDLKLPASRNPFRKLLNLFLRTYRIYRIKKTEKIDTSISFLEGANVVNVLSGISRNILSVRTFRSLAESNKGFYGFVSRWLTRILYNQSDAVIAASQAIKEDLSAHFGVRSDKTKVIYNFLNTNEIARLIGEPLSPEHARIMVRLFECTELQPTIPGSNSLRSNCQSMSVPVIINVGRLARPKGQWHLIRAFSRVKQSIPQCKLVILGAGELETPLLTLARELNVSNDVYLLGPQDNPFKYLAKSSVFALSSILEGFPNVLIEAMSCGLPVVATDCQSGPREILAPNTTRRCAPSLSPVGAHSPVGPNGGTSSIEYAPYGILTPVPDGIFRPPYGGAHLNNAQQITREESLLVDALTALLTDKEMHRKYARLSKERAFEFTADKIVSQWRSLL